MNKLSLSKFKPIFDILLFGLLGFAIHKLCFYLFVSRAFEDNFVYSILTLYFFFFCFSAALLFALQKIKEINIDYVGYSFLLLTSLKIGAAFIFAKPIMANNLPKTPTEKFNFFVIFIYFLAIETYLTIRILNNKQ
jgi:hypothetical protein